MKRRLLYIVLIGPLSLVGCSKKETAVDQSQIMPMLGAVQNSETDELRRLAEKHIGLDEREPANQSTPMIVASSSDQWPVVEILIDHGADIWAHDQFGITMAQMAVTSRILPGSTEDYARLRVIEKLKLRGYPFPPPDSNQCSRSTRPADGCRWESRVLDSGQRRPVAD